MDFATDARIEFEGSELLGDIALWLRSLLFANASKFSDALARDFDTIAVD